MLDREHHPIALLRGLVAQSGLTQQEIARKIGVHQSQVSRLLNGKGGRTSKSMHKLCESLTYSGQASLADRVRANADLVEAVAFAWDGSPHHATALAAVIRSLRVLRPPDD